MRTRTTFTVLALAAALVAAAPASAHVTAQPPEQPAGGFTVVTLRVPNESTAPTTRLEVQFPDGITSARTRPVAGWTAEVNMEQLDEPIDDGHGGEVTEQVASITFTGGEVQDGQFEEFPISFRMVEEGQLGDLVFFPTVQTYGDGEQAAWIEKPASADDDTELERPAPTVTLVESGDSHGGGGQSGEQGGEHSSSSMGEIEDDVASARTLALAGLALGALALLLGFVALRRRG